MDSNESNETFVFILTGCSLVWLLVKLWFITRYTFQKTKTFVQENPAMFVYVRSFAVACSIAVLSFGAMSMMGFINVVEVSSAYVDEDSLFVTYQSAIKLELESSTRKYFLNSNPEQNYGSGSGQQVVTFSPTKTDQTSLWVVREGHNEPQMEAGKPVRCGTIIRLTHNSSNRNLHSHLVRSGLTGNQEVSGFGSNGEGDDSDNWKVVCSGRHEDNNWERGNNRKVRLLHVNTHKYLMAAEEGKYTRRNCGGNCPIMNHLEAFAKNFLSSDSLLSVTGGIYLSL